MKKRKVLIFIAVLVAIVFCVLLSFYLYKIIVPSPYYSQEVVENYISKYSKDFTFLRKETYSIGVDGFRESVDTDWYYHDNELDFDFHVKTLKSEYPPKGEHIYSHYYNYYMEKLLNIKEQDINRILMDVFDEIYNINSCTIRYNDNHGAIIIYINGEEREEFSSEKYVELSQIASKKICECIEEFDSNFKSRSKSVGWDTDLNTSWSVTDNNLEIVINGQSFVIDDYYNNNSDNY